MADLPIAGSKLTSQQLVALGNEHRAKTLEARDAEVDAAYADYQRIFPDVEVRRREDMAEVRWENRRSALHALALSSPAAAGALVLAKRMGANVPGFEDRPKATLPPLNSGRIDPHGYPWDNLQQPLHTLRSNGRAPLAESYLSADQWTSSHDTSGTKGIDKIAARLFADYDHDRDGRIELRGGTPNTPSDETMRFRDGGPVKSERDERVLLSRESYVSLEDDTNGDGAIDPQEFIAYFAEGQAILAGTDQSLAARDRLSSDDWDSLELAPELIPKRD